ncbi:winged helix-turn-helix transcriptional regulator [Candidatus Woesearchaeota archaeon]|nr:winged helix-turn-helix transcriptional regulator [Candidatus Woesearchaeota archaeon]
MTKKDVCEIQYVNKKAVAEVRSRMLDNNTFSKMAERFKLLGDPTRVKILFILSQKELCVCDIAALLKASQSAISHQLRALRNSNLAKSRKEGKIVYYSLADEHVIKLIDMSVKHAEE